MRVEVRRGAHGFASIRVGSHAGHLMGVVCGRGRWVGPVNDGRRDPATWAACVRFLHSTAVVDRCSVGDDGAFLLAVYTAGGGTRCVRTPRIRVMTPHMGDRPSKTFRCRVSNFFLLCVQWGCDFLWIKF